ncbi:MAG: TetR family transcriptional regulator [Pseudomonadota bacterium]
MTTRQQRYDNKRLAAIRAAAAEFAEHGYHGSSTAGIAQRLGIQQGSLYYYLKSKEEALEEVCLLALGEYVTRMEKIAETDQPFAAQLLAAVTAHLLRYREKNEALKVYNSERLYLPAARRRRLKKLGSHYRQLLESLLKKAIDRGELREIDAHFAAQMVIGVGNAMGELIVRDTELDVVTQAQKCCDLLLTGMNNPQNQR